MVDCEVSVVLEPPNGLAAAFAAVAGAPQVDWVDMVAPHPVDTGWAWAGAELFQLILPPLLLLSPPQLIPEEPELFPSPPQFIPVEAAVVDSLVPQPLELLLLILQPEALVSPSVEDMLNRSDKLEYLSAVFAAGGAPVA